VSVQGVGRFFTLLALGAKNLAKDEVFGKLFGKTEFLRKPKIKKRN